MDDPKGNGSAERVGAKCAFLGRLDLKLAAAGYPVRAPAPAPPKPAPAPLLTFEAWAELSARFAGAPPEDLAAALAARGLTLEVWKRFDDAYGRALSDDVRAGQRERPAIYEARYKEERAQLAGHVSAPAEGTPVAESIEPAPADLRGTNGAPDLPAAVLATIGRMPFVPPAPPEKRLRRTGEAPGQDGGVEGDAEPRGEGHDGPRRRLAAADAQPAVRREPGRHGCRPRAAHGRAAIRGAPRRARAPAGATGADAAALPGAERGGAPRARGAMAAPGTAGRAGGGAGGFRGGAARATVPHCGREESCRFPAPAACWGPRAMSDVDDDPALPSAAPPAEPRIYRTMVFETDETGRRWPQVGAGKNMLGARLPPDNPADVQPDAEGNVARGDEGLSVRPSLKAFPNGQIPERLRDRRPGARGSDDLRLFCLGQSPFEPSHIAEDLELQPTSKTHGVVRPRAQMHVDRYQARLAATQPRWIDEG